MKRIRRFTALTLSACMVMSLFSVCPQGVESAAEEPVAAKTTRDPGGAGEVIEVMKNAEGVYTITITEGNLTAPTSNTS